MQKRNLVLFAKALVVIGLMAAVSIVIYAKRGPSEAKSETSEVAASEPADDAEQPPKEKPDAAPARNAPLPRLVDLGADKCIPCKMMAPVLEQLKTEYAGKLDVVFIDVWKDETQADKYGIWAIPTQIFFDASGKELFRHEGFFAKEDILAKWKELGVFLGPAQQEK